MAEVTKKKEKDQRPSPNAYWQQRLRSWDPVMTPFTVIITLLVIGIVFLPIGVTMLFSSISLLDKSVQYGGVGTDATLLTDCADGICTYNFEFEEKTQGPLYLYYGLDNYFQNNIKYSSSVNWDQMMGKSVPNEELESKCDSMTFNDTSSTIVYSPCGLIAHSFFTDTYQISSSNVVPTPVLSFDDITGSIDTSLFSQPEGFVKLAVPAGTCASFSAVTDCSSYANMPTTGCQCYIEPSPSIKEWVYSYPNQDTTRYLYEMFPSIISPIAGVTDPHFMNWMNIAALPKFRKLYGIIQGNFNKGDNIMVAINSNYDVLPFQGKKWLTLSATGSLGVSNPGLGITYIVTGAVCIFCSLVFFLKYEINPRPLGSPELLNWK